jgi:hypothetical protein
MYLQKTNLSCQHITKASTYITVHYRNGIHALSRCMHSLGHPPFEWSVSLPRMSDMRNAHVWNTWQHTTHKQTRTSDTLRLNGVYPCLAWSTCGMHTYETRGNNPTHKQTRRWDSWNGSLHQPSQSRDAAQHTYKTHGSSSLALVHIIALMPTVTTRPGKYPNIA